MTHSVLASFDPLATHPFTNNSGLMPKPAAPSKYPHPAPSHAKSTMPMTTQPNTRPRTPTQHNKSNVHIHAPQPTRSSPAKQSSHHSRGPIFVPFRPERSSPELDDILLRKKVSDVLSNKQTWSIDQAPVPPHSKPLTSSTVPRTKKTAPSLQSQQQ